MRYLVAVDGWEPSHNALEFAIEQAEDCGAELDIVHVVDEDGGDPDANDQIRESIDEALAGHDVDAGVEFVETSKRTRPAKQVGNRLLELAEERGYDVIILGNEETGHAERAIVGSVGSTVVDARSVPVLLVP